MELKSSLSRIFTLPCKLVSLLVLLLGIHLTTGLGSFKVMARDVEAAASEPEAAVAEPNLGTLLGLGNPLASGNPAALLQGLGGHSLPTPVGALSGVPNLQALRDSGTLRNICNNAGNSDALTNLLLYQYFSGALPGGPASAPNPVRVAAVRNPHLQALLEGSLESRTTTTVTTTLTTRTITMEASTKFSTSTTSYVTTITSLTSSVLPIIFRGSKITTTITDRKTEILTATEFYTSSIVSTPSIIQTLNVEVTLTETSTKGLNGHFTLAQVTPGASKIIEQPVSSTSMDLDIDLSTLNLANIRGDNVQVVNALSAILQQYNDESESERRPPPRKRGPGNRSRQREDRNGSGGGGGGGGGNFGNTRFHTRSRFSTPEKDAPKFNVIRGFTLSDRPAAESGSSGTALENTRYSKFRKKNNVENNSLGASEPDRENERFSASTSRRTVSRADERRRETQARPRSRSQSNADINARSSGVRTNRQTERSRRRSGRTLDADDNRENVIRLDPDKMLTSFKTTLLTMHISGVKPGEVLTTVRTVTLRGLGTARIKRQIIVEPASKLEPIVNTKVPDLTSALQPEEVVRLLKSIDKSTVRRMLHSLHDWVDYYLHQVLDETIEPSFISGKYRDIITNEIPELYSSQIEEESSSSQDATVALAPLPNAITGEPVTVSSSANFCPKVSVVTETVYQTLYNSHPH